jgi:hypothetical protein
MLGVTKQYPVKQAVVAGLPCSCIQIDYLVSDSATQIANELSIDDYTSSGSLISKGMASLALDVPLKVRMGTT